MDRVKVHCINEHKLPLVIEPEEVQPLEKWLAHFSANREWIKQNLLTYGGLLFRNFPINQVDGFSDFIEALNLGKGLDYIGGDSPRIKVKGCIYTSTEAPPSVKIPLHNELSFVKHYPKHIYFYCQIAPEQGGETIIGDARKIYSEIHSDVKQRFIERGLRYESAYHANDPLIGKINKYHKSWMAVFETGDKKEVEKKCLQGEFIFQWKKNDWLQICQERPAVLAHPETQEAVWFNQVHLYDFNPKLLNLWHYLGTKMLYFRKHTRLHEVFFQDKTPIPRKDLYHIIDVLDKNTIYFPWKAQDVLVLDNVLAMHGRATFKGKRRILAAMTG